MTGENLHGFKIEDLLTQDAATKLKKTAETIANLQRVLLDLNENEDGISLEALRIGTVFQIFLVDVLASGKRPGDLTEADWKGIADKVYKHAVAEDERMYSEFVFKLYADYIDISAQKLRGLISAQNYDAIRELADTIRRNGELLRSEELTEVKYVDSCLWLSLEAMIKLMSLSLTALIGRPYAELAANVSQLAFEYGRYVLFSKEQALLEQYVQNQRVLDEKLRGEYESYLSEVEEQAERFRGLIDDAFTVNLCEALRQSAALAQEAGVPEDEILTSMEDIDAFFLD